MIEGNRAYIPALYVFNKIDAITIEELDILGKKQQLIGYSVGVVVIKRSSSHKLVTDQLPNYVPISSQHKWNVEGM